MPEKVWSSHYYWQFMLKEHVPIGTSHLMFPVILDGSFHEFGTVSPFLIQIGLLAKLIHVLKSVYLIGQYQLNH